MAIGLLGNPLMKGHGEVISTCMYSYSSGAQATPHAGRLCVLLDTEPTGQLVVAQVSSGNWASRLPHGVLTHDFFKSRNIGERGVISVCERGMSIPVQIEGSLGSVQLDGVGYTINGKFCAANNAAAKGIINAKFSSLNTFTALDEDGKEVPCALIDLYSPMRMSPIPTLVGDESEVAKAEKATK